MVVRFLWLCVIMIDGLCISHKPVQPLTGMIIKLASLTLVELLFKSCSHPIMKLVCIYSGFSRAITASEASFGRSYYAYLLIITAAYIKMSKGDS